MSVFFFFFVFFLDIMNNLVLCHGTVSKFFILIHEKVLIHFLYAKEWLNSRISQKVHITNAQLGAIV